MRRAVTAAIIGTALIGGIGTILLVDDPVAAQAQSGSSYHATLRPLNGVGQGEAELTLNGRTLQVHITASGLEADGIHLGHIHGVSTGRRPVDSRCPTLADDTDDDGWVELGEGIPLYGAILVDFGNIDPNVDGSIDFTTTVQLSGQAVQLPLNKRHIVVHGGSAPAVGAGTPGEVNGTAGYKVVLPMLCGEIEGGSKEDTSLEFREVPRQ